jgi:voltage-gated potassium channel Kch
MNTTAWLYRHLFDTECAQSYARQIEKTIAWLIVASVFSIALEHIPEVASIYQTQLHLFDVFAVAVFTLEYLLRWYTAAQNPEYATSKFPRIKYLFNIYALVDFIAIAPFYLALLIPVDVELLRALRLFRLMRMLKFSRQIIPAVQEFQQLNTGRSFRQKIYALTEPTHHSGKLHEYIDNLIVFWVALSILCVILESVESIHQLFSLLFHWVDVAAFSIFTIEYIARLYASAENPQFNQFKWSRLAYARSWQALIDLFTILPFILEMVMPYQLDLRFLRVFRLMRLLKLTRYSSATQTLGGVLKREWPVIFSAMFVLFLLIILTASLGYLIEHDAQPDIFSNIPEAIYWSMTTLSSIGYGDMTPITPLGRGVTAVVALIGVGIFAIPAGLLASAFTDQLQQDRAALKEKIAKAYAAGDLTEKVLLEITQEAERLHISTLSQQRIMDEAQQEYADTQNNKGQFAGLVINAMEHPEFASHQFKTLIQQLQFLISASDQNQLHADLVTRFGAESDEVRVFQLYTQTNVAQ